MVGFTVMAAALLAVGPGDPIPAAPTLATCEKPAERAALLNGNGADIAILDHAKAYNAEQEAEFHARMDALGMTKEERSDLAIRVLKMPAFDEAFTQGVETQKQVMADLRVVMASKDPTVNCRAIVHMIGLMPSVLASAEAQWAVFRAELDAEAARRGKTSGQ